MATLDYTGDGGSRPPNPFNQKAQPVVLYRRLKIADIIAADPTMTANGYIAANDIIEALDVPAGFLFERAVLRVITPCTATVTVEVGLAGGAEMIGSTPVDVNAAAGTAYVTIEADSYDLGHFFAAADTIDLQFLIANCLVGDLELFVFGQLLQLGAA